MRRRLLTGMILVAVLAVAGFGVPLAVAVRARSHDEVRLRLSREANRAAVAVPGSFARDQDTPELPAPAEDTDVALYDAAGELVVGNGPGRADPTVLAALAAGTAEQDRRRFVVAIPVSEEEVVVGAIRAATPAGVVSAGIWRTWALMALWAGAVLGAATLVGLRRSRTLTRPLALLRDDASIVGSGGELAVRQPSGVPEIDAIGGALRTAAEQLNKAFVRERSLSADLSHQLRTPLASLRLRLETEQLAPSADQTLLADALGDVDRLEQTIADLLALARDADRQRESHAVTSLVCDAAARWRTPVQRQGRRLAVNVESALPWANVSAAAFRQILDVVLDNALTHGAGTITLAARQLGAGVVIAVSDEGDAVLDAGRVFVRRHPDAASHGIGLALAARLAAAEDMRLVLANPGPGATFHLVIG